MLNRKQLISNILLCIWSRICARYILFDRKINRDKWQIFTVNSFFINLCKIHMMSIHIMLCLFLAICTNTQIFLFNQYIAKTIAMNISCTMDCYSNVDWHQSIESLTKVWAENRNLIITTERKNVKVNRSRCNYFLLLITNWINSLPPKRRIYWSIAIKFGHGKYWGFGFTFFI